MNMNEKMMSTLVNGMDDSITRAAKERLTQSIASVSKSLNDAKLNNASGSLLGTGNRDKGKGTKLPDITTDAQIYTNISDMINGSNNDSAGFGTLMESLVMKNKKYYSIIKDYEIMPILIPQINRVLMFLVNECLSPDIQNDATFLIKYTGSSDVNAIQNDIEQIKKEMKLDNLLRNVYMNRYKLGHEYMLVIDYNQTFQHMLDMIARKGMNESTQEMSDMDFLENSYTELTSTINECAIKMRIQHTDEPKKGGVTVADTVLHQKAETKQDEGVIIQESTIELSFEKMNILIERSPIAHLVQEAHGELISEAYSEFKLSNIMNHATTGTLNEAVLDTSKLTMIVNNMKRKKLRRCMIERLDPAKVFCLKIGGRTIGYFVVEDLTTDAATNTINFAQALKDQLLKSRATNLQQTTKTAEEIISKSLAEKIINTFDANVGINRIEDIDLLHDYVLNNEIYKGNKRLTFYYEDEIFDMSRADDSILTNAVFFTKLYATLLMNNIMTKVLRGRGRQIHTVHMGASPNIQRYIQNAMASLTMPENNLGTLHGSFEQILNPFNASSDIIIPTDESTEKYIETDYIPGQDVDMNDDFLRTLLNAIVSSFGLDSAVIDATNGNLQFARTLSMESLQICNAIKNEQQDLHDAWEAMCLRILSICGNDQTREALEQGLIEVKFFTPKSLVMQNTIEDLNNAKSYAENIADIIPDFNVENAESKRNKFIYSRIKSMVNLDWTAIDDEIKECAIDSVGDEIEAKIQSIIQEYKDNTVEEKYGDANGDGIVSDEDSELTDEEKEFLPGNDDSGDEEDLEF